MAEADACLRLVRCSGSAGEVCPLDTGSVSVRAKRQREAAAIVDAVYALQRPVLAMYLCCVAAEGWAGYALSYASWASLRVQLCRAPRLGRCGARCVDVQASRMAPLTRCGL